MGHNWDDALSAMSYVNDGLEAFLWDHNYEVGEIEVGDLSTDIPPPEPEEPEQNPPTFVRREQRAASRDASQDAVDVERPPPIEPAQTLQQQPRPTPSTGTPSPALEAPHSPPPPPAVSTSPPTLFRITNLPVPILFGGPLAFTEMITTTLEAFTGEGTVLDVKLSEGNVRSSAIVSLDLRVDPSRVTSDYPRSQPFQDKFEIQAELYVPPRPPPGDLAQLWIGNVSRRTTAYDVRTLIASVAVPPAFISDVTMKPSGDHRIALVTLSAHETLESVERVVEKLQRSPHRLHHALLSFAVNSFNRRYRVPSQAEQFDGSSIVPRTFRTAPETFSVLHQSQVPATKDLLRIKSHLLHLLFLLRTFLSGKRRSSTLRAPP
ncbi:hypothetical protein RQP46_004102 [Phenoliferia psychrophenolica]